MSNYTKVTDFATKDGLPAGNPSKLVKGTEIDVELVAIENAIPTKADLSSPTFTGTITADNITYTGTLTGIVDGGAY